MKQVKLLMEQARAAKEVTVNKDKLLAAPEKDLLAALSPYFADSNLAVRNEALHLNMRLGTASKDAEVQRKSIQHILANCVFDKMISNQLVNLLKKYNRSHFSAVEVKMMGEVLIGQERNVGTLAKIYAFAGGADAMSTLKELLNKAGINRNDKKDIKLALVRCGDVALSEKMLETLKQQVVNDEFLDGAVREVLYTRNKSLIQFLLDAVLKDDKKCSGGQGDGETPVICAYGLVEQLAPVIKNFPGALNARGEIVEKDRAKMLNTVRIWIKSNRETFEVEAERY